MRKSITLLFSCGVLVVGCQHASKPLTYTADTSPKNDDKVVRTVSADEPVAALPPANPTAAEVKVVENPAAAQAEARAIIAIDTPNAIPPKPAMTLDAIADATPPGQNAQVATTAAPSAPAANSAIEPLSAHSPAKAPAMKDAVPPLSAQITDWKLTPVDIASDVQSLKLERSRAPRAGEPTGAVDSIVAKTITEKSPRN